MSTEPAPASTPARRRPILPVIALVVALVVVAIVAMQRLSAPPPPAKPRPLDAQPQTAGAPTPPATEAAKAPVTPSKPSPEPKAPLPPLIAGNPLTDDRFAAISCSIVIAALGLKQDAEWEANVMAYMARELKKAEITPTQYNDYALALHQNPERGGAVGENIMRRVEKKIGHRVTMEALPMFKFDQETIKKMEELSQ
jgi:hypothetical protein